MTTKDSATTAAKGAPIIVDLGKKKRKDIKKLRDGRGKLMDEVDQVVQELKSAGKIKTDAQAVVVVVRQKKRNNWKWAWS